MFWALCFRRCVQVHVSAAKARMNTFYLAYMYSYLPVAGARVSRQSRGGLFRWSALKHFVLLTLFPVAGARVSC